MKRDYVHDRADIIQEAFPTYEVLVRAVADWMSADDAQRFCEDYAGLDSDDTDDDEDDDEEDTSEHTEHGHHFEGKKHFCIHDDCYARPEELGGEGLNKPCPYGLEEDADEVQGQIEADAEQWEPEDRQLSPEVKGGK